LAFAEAHHVILKIKFPEKIMKTLPMILIFALCAFASEKQKLVGEIEFFGYSKVDIKKLRERLPFQEGDEFKIEKKGELAKILLKAQKAVLQEIGRPPTDVAPVCCNKQGDWMIYIGLGGKAADYAPAPEGDSRLPDSVIKLYDRLMRGLEEAIRKGEAEEDRSKGYALSVVPSVRSDQLKMREYALANESLLLDVLRNSADARQRFVAAEFLGYARQSARQVCALANASRDENSTVRNNAARALGVLLESNPKLAADVPAEYFLDLLLSGKWSDVNKAGMFLYSRTQNRDEKVLALLRRPDVMERLLEIARWRTFHSDAAKYLLGRMAGISEERLKQLVTSGNTEEILGGIAPARRPAQ
jgi:hypothetical protein